MNRTSTIGSDLRPLRQFVALDLIAAIAGLFVTAVVVVTYDASWLWPLLAGCGGSVILLAAGYVAAGRGHVDLAVYLVVSTFWLMLVMTTTMVPSIFGGFAVLMVWPVLLAVPHVTRATLRSIAVVTATVSGLTIPLALRTNSPRVTSDVPGWVFDSVFIVVGVVFVGLSLNQVWAYSGRLTGALADLRAANFALVRSERELEARVAARTAELAAVIDNIADGLITLDANGAVSRLNPAARRMFGSDWSADTLAWLSELSEHDADTPAVADDIPLGEGRVGRAVATRITEASGGQRRGTVVMVSDVTTAREVDRMKTDFISTVSHELRTPLTSVLGFVKLIRRRFEERIVPALGDAEPATAKAVAQVRNDLGIIISEGERLARLINDLLDIAKIEAGRVEWRDEPVLVNEVVSQGVAATRSLFEARRLPLQVDLDPSVGVVRGDPHRIVQVVVNLLSNACKFTEHGHVTITTQAQHDGVTVSVADTGPGIHPDDFPRLFERFKQVGDTLTDKPTGTGLGLPICKEIIDHHGGRLTVDSRVGEGSTFAFTLPGSRRPVQTAGHDTTRSAAQSRDRRLRPLVLVVDDDESHRALLRAELEMAGFDVEQAANGTAALDAARRLLPDVITLDVLMPDIDGFAVAHELRRDARTATIPIVMITIADGPERAARAGIDRYMPKPVEASRLVGEVRSLLATRSITGTPMPPSSPAT
jgi:signal transduction histidine kinase/ActR/RegA family two-component response regulator